MLRSVTNIGNEVFIRQIIREKKNIQDLMAEIDYSSPEMTYLLSTIPDKDEDAEAFIEAMRYEDEIDEVKSNDSEL